MAGVLGISPGTRTLGVVIIDHKNHIVKGKIKTFNGKWSETKQQRITAYLSKIVATYRITTIAIKIIHTSRCSPQLNSLQKAIKAHCRQHHIKLHRYTTHELLCHVGAEKSISKDIIMDYLVEKYPQLLREFTKEKRNQNPYYIKLFEAIAVADMSV